MFHNRLTAAKIRLLIVALLSGVIIGILSGTMSPNRVSALWGFGISAFCFISYWIVVLGSFNYFFFNDEGGKFVFRYYFIHPGMRKLRAVEMPKTELGNFEVKKSMGGLKKHLLLTQKTRKGNAKYPPISISGLNKKELKQLTTTLARQLVQNQGRRMR